MPQEPGALTGILAIEPPMAPPDAGDMWLTVTVTLVLLAGIAYMVRRWHSSPRTRARRRLAALQRVLDQRQIDSRRAVFELAAILRDAFGVHHLSTHVPSLRRMPTPPPPLKKGKRGGLKSPLPPLFQGGVKSEFRLRRMPESRGVIETQWRAFVEQLTIARYAAHDADPAQLDGLLRDARQWLRRGP